MMYVGVRLDSEVGKELHEIEKVFRSTLSVSVAGHHLRIQVRMPRYSFFRGSLPQWHVRVAREWVSPYLAVREFPGL